MRIGYARTSTLDQKASIEAQEEHLKGAGCEKLFKEQVSSVDVVRRDELARALDYLREGDTLVVCKLDRLARSMAHLVEITGALERKGAALKILDLDIDTGTATGRLILHVLAGIAAFEREIMLERQREGIAKAKAAGKYKGRKPTARAKADQVRQLQAEGWKANDIAAKLGIGRSSVYRILEGTAEREGGAAARGRGARVNQPSIEGSGLA